MPPKIYHLHPLVAGPLAGWQPHFARCRDMGFDIVCVAPPFVPDRSGNIFATADYEVLHPALHWDGCADSGIEHVVSLASEHGLRLWLDLSFERVGTSERLIRLVRAGVTGFRCLEPGNVPVAKWRSAIDAVRKFAPDCAFLAWTPGMPRPAMTALEGAGFDYACSSLAWWDGRAPWFAEEAEVLWRVASVIAAVEPSFAERRASRLDPYGNIPDSYRHALHLAATTANGMFVPMGFEYATRRAFDATYAEPADFQRARDEAVSDLSGDIRAANAMVDRVSALGVDGGMRMLTGPRDSVTVLLRTDTPDARVASHAAAVLINPDLGQSVKIDVQLTPLPPQAGAAIGMPEQTDAAETPMSPGEVRILTYSATKPVIVPECDAALELPLLASTRIAIEAVRPSVPDGNFAVKHVVGKSMTVSADIIADGHDKLSAAMLWRAMDEPDWHRVPMVLIANDRWEARFIPERIGRHQFTVEAWWDTWGTFEHNLSARHAAGQNVELEIQEGIRALQAAATAAPKRERGALQCILKGLKATNDTADRVAVLLSPETQAAMQAVDDQPFLARHSPPILLDANRPQAAFASWYEMFPRSATDDPARHGTFKDVIERLPAIRAMGFDVLYFPPIHPIGVTNRKGRNNALRAEPDDVGSPYAIGGADGGHDAIHRQLGTFNDFQALIKAARDNQLEIALDFAIQCSPDHPWLREHPDWFQWRPDGSIRFAENPPKRYEDIVNPDFYADAAVPDLWLALRDVVRFWITQGIRTFRVDNPHTKPLPFWHWMINSITSDHPDVIFLAEAFTRPKMMYRLAKVGFTQSYTYFTWRHTKREIIEYLTELNSVPVRDLFRPNFFVNTPDINPPFLQQSGRPGFLIRAVLACTLSGLWGMYSGFELCESEPLPGREEYLDSEKYQIRVRDFSAPGNIIPEITALNRIRRAHPALQTHLGVTFYSADNDQVLYHGKGSPARGEMILVAVNLDPHIAQEAVIELPLWEFGLPDDAALAAIDLMRGHNFVWRGKIQRIRLDPAELPFSIWHVAPPRGFQ